MDTLIFNHFQQRIESTMALAEQCQQQLPAAAELIAQRLVSGGKLVVCSGPDEALLGELAEHYCLFGCGFERPPFPVLALPCGATSTCLALLRQHAGSADALLLFGASLAPETRAQLLEEAARLELAVVSLGSGGHTDEPSVAAAVSLTAAEPPAAPLVNRQLEALQCLCHLVDRQVFGA